jgi:hypothetical protein
MTAPARPPAVSAAISRIGAPAKNSSAIRTMPIDTVMPRSGCSTSNTKISNETGTTGDSACFQRCMRLRRSASTCAPQSVSATLTASDGCTENGPKANHAREPPRRAPRPGMSTATSARMPISSSGAASARSRGGGIRRPTQNITSPTAQNMSCLTNTEYDEPSAA